jgi:glycerophosphoryl diester phosphodiesterase
LVHPFTFRAENPFLPTELRIGVNPTVFGDLAAELAAFLATDIDGFFTDHANLGVAARDAQLVHSN